MSMELIPGCVRDEIIEKLKNTRFEEIRPLASGMPPPRTLPVDLDEMSSVNVPLVKFSDKTNHAITMAKTFASFDPKELSKACGLMDKVFEDVKREVIRRQEAMKDNILVLIGNKAYKPRVINTTPALWETPNMLGNPSRVTFTEHTIEVVECPSAERHLCMDVFTRVEVKPKKIIFNGPATIVFWKDGTKTVVKAENEEFDPEKGVAMAYLKKFLGNKGNYFNTIKKAIKMAEVENA